MRRVAVASVSGRAAVVRALPVRGRETLNAAAMLFADGFAVCVALALAAGFVAWSWAPSVGGSLWAAALAGGWLAAATGWGLYPGWGLGAVRELARVARAATVGFGTAIAVALLVEPPLSSHGLVFLGLAGLLAAALAPLARAGARELLVRAGGWGAPTLVVGGGLAARTLARRLLEEPGLGFQPVAVLDPGGAAGGTLGGLPVHGTFAGAHAAGARVALLAELDADRERQNVLLDEALTRFSRVVVAGSALDAQPYGVTATSFGDALALDLRRALGNPGAHLAKRAFDLACVVIASPAWLPMVGVTALLTWLEDRHPPFYRQARVGYRGRVFRVWKLRTMVPNAEAALKAHLEASPAARLEWETHFKLKRDPRITRWGKLFRKLSLDELPQLLNVITGEMSLVGPRPLPAYHHDALPAKAAELRTRALPGLTGLWQVEGRSDTDLAGMARLDSHYVRNWSFWYDLVILARTVGVVLFGKGAY